jgi:hypothetical protein
MSKFEQDMFGAVALVTELFGGSEGGEIAGAVREAAAKHVKVPENAKKYPGPPGGEKEAASAENPNEIAMAHCDSCDAWYHPGQEHGCVASAPPPPAPRHRPATQNRREPKEGPDSARVAGEATQFFCSHCGMKNQVPR